MQHHGYEYVCMGVSLCVIHVCVWYMCYTCVCMGVCLIHVCVWVYVLYTCVYGCIYTCVYACMCMGTNPDMHVIKNYANPF